uniref:Uncharacterized protein n=1 Tax=Plectus sambesii TaxID=2011161 RepID=A0A914XKW0_9BILA
MARFNWRANASAASCGWPAAFCGQRRRPAVRFTLSSSTAAGAAVCARFSRSSRFPASPRVPSSPPWSPVSSPQVPKTSDASAMKAAVESTSPPAVAQATTATLKRSLSVNGDDTAVVVSAKVPKVESVDENKNGVIMTKLAPLSTGIGCGTSNESVKPSTASSSSVEMSHPVDPGHPPPSLFVQTSASTSTGVHPTSALGQQSILFGGGQSAGQATGLLAADPLRQALLASSNPAAAYAAAFSGLPTSAAGNYPFLSPPGFPQSFHGLLPPPFLHGQSPLGVPTSTAAAHGTQLPTASGLVRPAGSQSLAQTADPPAAASVKKRGKWCAVHVRIAWDISKNRFPAPKPGAVVSSSSFTSSTPSTSVADVKAGARITAPDKQRPPSSSRATPSRSSSAATPATAPSSSSMTSMHNGAATDAAATLNAMAAAAAACGLPTSYGQTVQTSQAAYFPSSSNPFLSGMGAAALFGGGGGGGHLVAGSSQASRMFESAGSFAPPNFANLTSGHLPPHLLSGGIPTSLSGQMPFSVSGMDALRMQIEQQQLLERLGIGPCRHLVPAGGVSAGQLGQLMGAGFPGFMGGGGGKAPMPFSNTLEQLARHKRDGPADLVNSTNR